MADAPSVAKYGKVTGLFSMTTADSKDALTVPDKILLRGQITFIPEVDKVIWNTTPKETTFIQTVICRVYNGLIYAPDADPEGLAPDPDGVWLLSSAQANGTPSVIKWRAVFLFDHLDTQPTDRIFDVLISPAVTEL